MPTTYAHTNIVSDDWRRLVRFYQDVFDCVPIPPQRDQSGTALAAGIGVSGVALQGMHLRLPGCGDAGPTLEIYQYDHVEPSPPSRANRRGLAHIAFRVDDVAAVRAAVLEYGGAEVGRITELEVPGAGHLTFVYMADPDGNLVEIQHWS